MPLSLPPVAPLPVATVTGVTSDAAAPDTAWPCFNRRLHASMMLLRVGLRSNDRFHAGALHSGHMLYPVTLMAFKMHSLRVTRRTGESRA